MNIELTFKTPLKITEKERQDINNKMRAYSQDRELEKEFDIKPDSTLYHFESNFENGFRAELSVYSGQVNCWIEVALYDKDNNEVDSGVIEDYLYYSDGTDEYSGDDDIMFYHNKNIYRLVITPKTEEDVKEYKAYEEARQKEEDEAIKAKLNNQQLKRVVFVGTEEELNKATTVLKENNINLVINENLLQEWCAVELQNDLEIEECYKTREELLQIADKFIDDDGIWTAFNEFMNDWVGEYLSEDKSSPFENKVIELRKQVLSCDSNMWHCLRPSKIKSIFHLRPMLEYILKDESEPLEPRIRRRMDMCLNYIYLIKEEQRDQVICEIEEVLANKEPWTEDTLKYFDEIFRGTFRRKIELNKK